MGNQQRERTQNTKQRIRIEKGAFMNGGYYGIDLVLARLEKLKSRKNRSDISDIEYKELKETLSLFENLMRHKKIPKDKQTITINRKDIGNNDGKGAYTVVIKNQRNFIKLRNNIQKAQKKQKICSVKEFESMLEQLRSYNELNPFLNKSFISSTGVIRWRADNEIDFYDVSQILTLYEKSGRYLNINTGTHGFENGQTIFTNKKLKKNKKVLKECQEFTEQDMDIVLNHPGVKFSITNIFHRHKVIWPKYPKELDTLDCWCFSYKTPMFKKDNRKFQTGQYFQFQDKLKKITDAKMKQELGIKIKQELGKILLHKKIKKKNTEWQQLWKNIERQSHHKQVINHKQANNNKSSRKYSNQQSKTKNNKYKKLKPKTTRKRKSKQKDLKTDEWNLIWQNIATKYSNQKMQNYSGKKRKLQQQK